MDATTLGRIDVSAISGAEISAINRFHTPCLDGKEMCRALPTLRNKLKDKLEATEQAAGIIRDFHSVDVFRIFGVWLLDIGCGHSWLVILTRVTSGFP